MRRAWLALGITLLLGLALVRVTKPLLERLRDPPLDLAFANREIPRGVALEDWFAMQAAQFASERVYLDAGAELLPQEFSALGIGLDVRATAERARRRAAPQGLRQRVWRAVGGPPRELAQVQAVLALDGATARTHLRALALGLDREPQDAWLDLTAHAVHEARAGRALDVEATLGALFANPPAPDSVHELIFRALPPKVVRGDLLPVDVSRVLASYETDFTRHAGARAVNIRRAAALLDRAVLGPGEEFSFNARVGPRVEARGFVKAPVIVHDETEPGLGGGVCQVATTLHAAAVFAALPITRRRGHSRPSGYAPLGLDATVIDGKVDLRFENPFDVALLIHAFLPTRTSVRVEILGHAPEGHVEHSYRVVERHAFYRRVIEHDELASGSFDQKQKGSAGYDIVSTLRLTRADGSFTLKSYPSKYYPVPEVFWIGHGTPLAALPPLPDGSLGLEPELEPDGDR